MSPQPARAAVGRPAVISLDDALEAATALAEQVGIDGLTMGLVAEKLGVTAAALYHYVPSKQALVNLVVDRAFEKVQAPAVDAGTWDERLRIFERAVRAELRRLKWGTPEVIVNGEPPASLRRLFGVGIDILSETGADEREVMLAYTTVYAFMVGQLWFDSATSDLPVGEPLQIRVAAEEAGITNDALFEQGIEIVISGLRQRLERSQRQK